MIIIQNHNKRIVINTGILYIRLILTLFITLFSTRYVLQGLGEADFGLYNLIAGTVALFGFISGTMAMTTQRFISYEFGQTNNLESVKKVFNTSVCLHILMSIIVAFVVFIGGLLLIEHVLKINTQNIVLAKYVLLFVALGLIWSLLSAPFEAILMARENIIFFATVRFIMVLVQFFIAVLIVYLPSHKLLTYAILMSIVPLIILLAQSIYCILMYPEIRFKRSYMRIKGNPFVAKMASFAAFSLFGNLGWTVRIQGFSIILNYFGGVLINAANGIANQVNAALLTLSSSLTTSIRPQLIQAAGSDNTERLLSLTRAACRYPAIIISIIGIPLFITMPYVLNIWLNNVPEYSVFFCRILIIDVMINQSSIGLALIMDAKGEIKFLHLLISISLVTFTFVAFVVGYFFNSIYLMYVCILINDLSIVLIRIFVVNHSIHKWGIKFKMFPFIVESIFKPCVIMGLLIFIGGIIWEMYPPSFIWFVLFSLLILILYCAITWFSILNYVERNRILNLIKSI